MYSRSPSGLSPLGQENLEVVEQHVLLSEGQFLWVPDSRGPATRLAYLPCVSLPRLIDFVVRGLILMLGKSFVIG